MYCRKSLTHEYPKGVPRKEAQGHAFRKSKMMGGNDAMFEIKKKETLSNEERRMKNEEIQNKMEKTRESKYISPQ
jgi:hypothetical protein